MKIRKRLTLLTLAVFMVLSMTMNVFAAEMSRSDAVNAALKNAGFKKTAVKSLEVEKEHGIYEVEFKDRKTGDKYEYEFRISDGSLKEISVDYKHVKNKSKKKVSQSKAIKAAAAAAGVKVSTVKKGSCKYKRDDGEWIYDIEFRVGSKEYEYEVLAPTGKVIEYSIEYGK